MKALYKTFCDCLMDMSIAMIIAIAMAGGAVAGSVVFIIRHH